MVTVPQTLVPIASQAREFLPLAGEQGGQLTEKPAREVLAAPDWFFADYSSSGPAIEFQGLSATELATSLGNTNP
jgi:hypothetical protein